MFTETVSKKKLRTTREVWDTQPKKLDGNLAMVPSLTLMGILEGTRCRVLGKFLYEGLDVCCILIQTKVSDCWTVWIKTERQQPWVTKMER